jgi:DNA ligase D-like protein (predicted 3'-phosphoesterase)
MKNNMKDYEKKRNFQKTQEPKGNIESSVLKKTKLTSIFVIQKHHATHLHYDLRLEIKKVLKSWAIPKEIPLKQGEKRLAIQVEDHPLEYANFHDIIPKGNYGAGKVKIWDKGTHILKKQTPNQIEIILNGKKAKGNYALIKTNFNKSKNSWLLIKTKD